MYAGRELEDGNTCADYKIGDQDIIYLILRLSGGTQVFLKTLRGKTITIEFEPFDTIKAVKQKILEREGIPSKNQRLVFDSQELADGLKISDYIIKFDSTIHLLLALRSGM